MKTLHLSITVMATVSMILTVLPVGAQCYGYGCGKSDSALNQTLLEKQTEAIHQKNEQLDQDSRIIALLIGVSITLGCVTGIVIWILFKTRKIIKK